MLAFDDLSWLLGGLQQCMHAAFWGSKVLRQLDFSMWVRSHPLLFLVFLPKLEEERMAPSEFAQVAGNNLFDQGAGYFG
ncbi:unnamed protein product [Prunus brigantina]